MKLKMQKNSEAHELIAIIDDWCAENWEWDSKSAIKELNERLRRAGFEIVRRAAK